MTRPPSGVDYLDGLRRAPRQTTEYLRRGDMRLDRGPASRIVQSNLKIFTVLRYSIIKNHDCNVFVCRSPSTQASVPEVDRKSVPAVALPFVVR
jgi:hypothetical protein